jgi:hypothetical protein
VSMISRFAVAVLVAGVVLGAFGCEDKPCPPPMAVCVSSQAEADSRNADLDPGCHIYTVCNVGDAGADAADVDATIDAPAE